MKKIALATLFCALCLSSAFCDSPFFSGYAGLLGDFTGDKEETTKLEPEFTMQGFLAAQIDWNGKLIFRGDFHIKSANLFNPANSPLKPTTENTEFKIGELSLTFRASSASVSHYISAFFGKFEPVGSDVFLQRHLGLQPISSILTENWGGLVGTSIFSNYGLGLSYTAHFNKSFVMGAYIYAYDSENGTFTINSFNTELRAAGTFPFIIFDVSANFSFEFATGKSLYESDPTLYAGIKDDLLLVRSALFKLGANILIGNRYTTSVLVQAGINNLSLGGAEHKQITGKDIYLLVEPRINLGATQMSIAVFSLPNENVRDLLYLRGYARGATNSEENGNVGANVSFKNDSVYLGATQLTWGVNVTACYDSNLISLVNTIASGSFDIKNMHLYVTPFASMPLFGGEFKAALSLDPLALASITENKNWLRIFDAFVGFKVSM